MGNKPLTVLLIGAGNRGADVYGDWIHKNPTQLQITAVAEPRTGRRLAVAQKHSIPPGMQFECWGDALGGEKIADVAIIATQDQEHTSPTLRALELGYEILLEKPMAHRLEDCIALVRFAEQRGHLLQIAHVLRYTDFFQHIHRIINSGILGQIITVSHRENVSSWHMAHSFVRGNWRRTDQSSPMVLAKSCHDLDILYWILNNPVKKLSSTGGLRHFIQENAPAGAPARCLDGCPVADSCPCYAPAFYLELAPITRGLANARNPLLRFIGSLHLRSPGMTKSIGKIIPSLKQLTEYAGWPRSIITDDPSNPQSLIAALETGPYGRCVYHCDNDVVDHQVVLMELENGISVSFTMHGHSHEEGRTIRIDGSQATLLGKFSWNHSFIQIHNHRTDKIKKLVLPNALEIGGHGGGDAGLMQAFVNTLRGNPPPTLTDARSALESHLLAFAAEQARITGTVIDFSLFREQAEEGNDGST